jgi:hypothetical protein
MDPTAPEQCVLLNQPEVFWLVFNDSLSWWSMLLGRGRRCWSSSASGEAKAEDVGAAMQFTLFSKEYASDPHSKPGAPDEAGQHSPAALQQLVQMTPIELGESPSMQYNAVFSAKQAYRPEFRPGSRLDRLTWAYPRFQRWYVIYSSI